MIFEASRAKALNQLNNFVENNLGEYSKLRNFDFGPEKRSNISCLSPYITHGIINEQEVIQKALCLLYTSPSPRDLSTSRMPSSA